MRIIIIAASHLLLLAARATRAASQDPISTPSTVPAFPVFGATNNRPPAAASAAAACQLDLSSELFGGVEEACGRGANLDRSRCCPVLAAWLFAAHARSALQLRASSSPPPAAKDPSPMMPETESKRCSDALQAALAARNIRLPRPNATCDAALCFCGIHLHDISSLSCPTAFNLTAAADAAVDSGSAARPTSEVRALERDCRNASYAGCTRCLNSLEKLKSGGGGGEERVAVMDRDCRLMGLTWLLGRNKTVYIPTVSAVLRAILYRAHPPIPSYGCSSDRENMPLAVDSLQFQSAAAGATSSASRYAPWLAFYSILALSVAALAGL